MKNNPGLPAIGALCLASLLAWPAAAQLVPLGPETVVAIGNELGLQCPQVIGHADRSFSVVWTQNPQVDQYSIVAQRYDGAGVPQGGRIDVDAGSLQHRRWGETRVANRGALGDIVTWSSSPAVSSGTPSRYDSRVLSAPAPARVATPSYIDWLSPRTGGGYLGTWAAKSSCSFALLDATGHPASPAMRINGSDPSFCSESILSANGSFALYWYHPNEPPAYRFRRFGPEAQPLGPESSAEDLHSGALTIASGPDGRTALAWVQIQTSPQGFLGTLRTQFFGADGRPASSAATVETAPVSESVLFPDAVAMDRQGRALILWEFLANDPFVERHVLQLRTPAGAASPILDLGAQPVTASVFCASIASAGRTWVIAWRAIAPDVGDVIYVRRFFS
jgi:hypothetical protein